MIAPAECGCERYKCRLDLLTGLEPFLHDLEVCNRSSDGGKRRVRMEQSFTGPVYYKDHRKARIPKISFSCRANADHAARDREERSDSDNSGSRRARYFRLRGKWHYKLTRNTCHLRLTDRDPVSAG